MSSPSNFNLDLPGRRGRKSSQRLSCVPLVSLIYISLEKYYLQFFLSPSTVYILWRNKFSFRRYLGKDTRGEFLTHRVRQTRFLLLATLYFRYCKKPNLHFSLLLSLGCIFLFLSFMIRSPVLRLSQHFENTRRNHGLKVRYSTDTTDFSGSFPTWEHCREIYLVAGKKLLLQLFN